MPPRADPFAALADPTRRTILESLRDEPEQTAGQIAGRFPRVSRAAVSKHLGVLRRAHLVRATHRGRERHYRLQADRVAQVREWLESFTPAMEQSLANLKRRAEGDPQP
jgi:DNA-binding transcriptional ArsR family regulator